MLETLVNFFAARHERVEFDVHSGHPVAVHAVPPSLTVLLIISGTPASSCVVLVLALQSMLCECHFLWCLRREASDRPAGRPTSYSPQPRAFVPLIE